MRSPKIKLWRAVVIYPERSVEPPEPREYRALFASPQVQKIYLNELEITEGTSLGVRIVRLVVETEERTAQRARELINQVQQQISDRVIQREIIDLIETVVVYKFPQLSRQELETMLGLGDIKQTKVYQEAKQEGLEQGLERGEQKAKLESIPRLFKMGLSCEQIAAGLDLPLAEVEKLIESQ